MVELEGASKRFGERVALAPADLDAAARWATERCAWMAGPGKARNRSNIRRYGEVSQRRQGPSGACSGKRRLLAEVS